MTTKHKPTRYYLQFSVFVAHICQQHFTYFEFKTFSRLNKLYIFIPQVSTKILPVLMLV